MSETLHVEDLHILLIDDDEDDYLLTRDLIEDISPGLTLDWVNLAEEGFEAAVAERYDVYLLDYRLGGETGLALLERIKAAGCSKPVIMLTGQNSYELDLASTRAGAADYLSKDSMSAAQLERSVRYAVAHYRTLAKLRQSQMDLQRAAFIDGLTGLPNRALFMDRLDRTINHGRDSIPNAAVLFIDLNRFKVLNDSLGHQVGDHVLKVIGRRLAATVREEDTVARLGGDEFTVLIDNIEDRRLPVRVAERIAKIIEQPIEIPDYNDAILGSSIGIAYARSQGDNPHEVLRNADIAMYRAKEQGGGYAIFDRDMHIELKARLSLERELHDALKKNEFKLYYQPIVHLGGGRVYGFEALLRWQRPGGDLTPPSDFLPVIEETGLIVPVGEWVLREACRWAASLGSHEMQISVNVSAKQLALPHFATTVGMILEETGLAPARLRLEITESVIMSDPQAVALILRDIKQLGVCIYLDDFGTGYSSLGHILEFPIDVIKIDRSFISKMTDHPKSEEIITAILSLAENLGLQVVAEGIETEEHWRRLDHLRCTFGQGYLFSCPLPAEQTLHYLAQHKAERRSRPTGLRGVPRRGVRSHERNESEPDVT